MRTILSKSHFCNNPKLRQLTPKDIKQVQYQKKKKSKAEKTRFNLTPEKESNNTQNTTVKGYVIACKNKLLQTE